MIAEIDCKVLKRLEKESAGMTNLSRKHIDKNILASPEMNVKSLSRNRLVLI